MTTLDIARGYAAAGLSVVPILADGSKKPAAAWKPYQKRLPTERELASWWGLDGFGVAIICGKVSGGLEVLDFDRADAFEAWVEMIEEQSPGLLARLPQVATPRGGRHVYYRVEKPSGNLKLARTASGETLIETRGEGGYVLAPGCPAACHPSGGLYQIDEFGPALCSIPNIGRSLRDASN